MEGQRVAKNPDDGHKGWFVVGGIVGLLVAAYLGVCLWLGASEQIYPNVTAAGVDVSGMTVEEAYQATNEAMDRYGQNVVITLSCEGWSDELCAADYERTGSGIGSAAWQVGRETFLLRGYEYLRHLLGNHTQVEAEGWNIAFNRSQPALEELIDRAEQKVGGPVVQMDYHSDGETLVVTKGVTGVAFDRERIWMLACDAVLDGLHKAADEGSAQIVIDLEQQGVVSRTQPDAPDFDAIHRAVYVQEQDAQVLPVTLEVTPHVMGVDFDVAELKRAYEGAKEGAEISVPLTIIEPKETQEGLKSKLFADLLGEAASRVSGTNERKFNVQLSAEACNGVVLMPGEEFSYNNTTGSRTADKGYLPAPVYIGGKSEDEVGGGICQTSSTIYYAALHTTLEIVERVNHRYAVGYVPDGMDATVYYGATDFRFKNNTNYPIKIETESYEENGVRKLKVRIYGTNEDGRYAIPERVQSDWIEPTVSYLADEEVPRGTLVLDKKQNAYTGVTAQVYRHVYEADGTFVETQDMGVSKYKMRPHLYHYNPLDGDPSTWVDGKPPVPQVEVPAEEPAVPAPEQPAEAVKPVEGPVSQDISG